MYCVVEGAALHGCFAKKGKEEGREDPKKGRKLQYFKETKKMVVSKFKNKPQNWHFRVYCNTRPSRMRTQRMWSSVASISCCILKLSNTEWLCTAAAPIAVRRTTKYEELKGKNVKKEKSFSEDATCCCSGKTWQQEQQQQQCATHQSFMPPNPGNGVAAPALRGIA